MQKETNEQNNIKKTIVPINALLVVVVFVLALIFSINTFFQDDLEEKVIVSYKYSNENNQCKDVKKPIEVSITNNSNKTIKEITIKMGLYKAGFSKEVSDHKLNKTTSNQIIKPNDTYTYCAQAPLEEFVKEVTPEMLAKKKGKTDLKAGDLIYLDNFYIKTQYKDITFKD